VEGVDRGIDMFDCVMPRAMRATARSSPPSEVGDPEQPVTSRTRARSTRNAAATPQELLAAYLRHLFNAGEVLALRLGTIHNLSFYLDLMGQIRKSIEEDGSGSSRRVPGEARQEGQA